MNQVWDVFVRSYHWLQALLFTLLCITGFIGDGQGRAHHILGFAIAALVLWRILWGLLGSATSRFVNFLPSASALRAYLQSGEYRGYGHNPLGAVMVAVILTLLLLQVAMGLLASDSINAATSTALAEAAASWHAAIIWPLLAATGLHVVAAIAHEIRGHGVIVSMIHGRQANAAAELQFQRAPRALALLLVSAALVLLLVFALGRPAIQT